MNTTAALRLFANELDAEELTGPMTAAHERRAIEAERPARILLAEDDTEMRSMLASALRADGYEVVEAHSGLALLEEIGMLLFRGEAFPADVIISDERMPGMFGLEVLSGLRQARWPIPFILITGFGDAQIHDRASRLGAAAVFDKPFDVDALREAVLRLLKERAHRDTAAGDDGAEPAAGSRSAG